MSDPTNEAPIQDPPAAATAASESSPPADPAAAAPPASDPPSSDPTPPTENPMSQQTGESYEDFVNRLAREGHIDRRKGTRAAAPSEPPTTAPAQKSDPKPATKPPQPKPQNPHWASKPLFGKRKRGS